MILAPIIRRKAHNNNVEEIPEEISRPIAGFRAAFVFDVGQTDGTELPRIGVVQGYPSDYTDRLRRFASEQNIAVEHSEEIAPARGTSYGGRIAFLPGRSSAEDFSTLAHELAHELLHRGEREQKRHSGDSSIETSSRPALGKMWQATRRVHFFKRTRRSDES